MPETIKRLGIKTPGNEYDETRSLATKDKTSRQTDTSRLSISPYGGHCIPLRVRMAENSLNMMSPRCSVQILSPGLVCLRVDPRHSRLNQREGERAAIRSTEGKANVQVGKRQGKHIRQVQTGWKH